MPKSPLSRFQASLAVLLDEKWELESRVGKLEQQLKEAHETVSSTAKDAAKTPSEPLSSSEATMRGSATRAGVGEYVATSTLLIVPTCSTVRRSFSAYFRTQTPCIRGVRPTSACLPGLR